MKSVNKKRLFAVLSASILTAGTLSSCSSTNGTSSQEQQGEADQGTPLVVGYLRFSEKFSPFFCTTSYDRDVADMTGVYLLGSDRTGAVVEKGIEGETRPYNGQDYTYTGIADVDITKGEDTTTYTFKLREDVRFSDGELLTADDAIFSYYVFCDPTYYGTNTVSSLPIVGLQNYRTQTSDEIYAKYSALFDEIYAAGEGSAPEGVDQAVADQMWQILNDIWKADVQNIVDYAAAHYGEQDSLDYLGRTSEEVQADQGLQVALAMTLWGFGTMDVETGVLTGPITYSSWNLNAGETPTIDDFFREVRASYGQADAYDAAGESAADTVVMEEARAAFISEVGSKDASMGEEGVANISGIQKISDTEFSVTLEGFDATAIYNIGIPVAPLHYYGDESLYDYDNNQFGFELGDLSSIESKTTTPMGAGPYVFDRYENNIVYFTANPYYWKGEPKIKYLQFKETDSKDMIAAVGTGAADISTPDGSRDAFKEIASYNQNGELSGDTLSTTLVENLGYGYIGINAANVRVGEDSDSEQSKALRKGLGTILAVYRDVVIDSYYGNAASVLNYPISNTSWAAPLKTDEDYRVAFSQAPDGSELYRREMTAEERYAAALQGTIDWLKLAGYTFDEAQGKFTAAPEGAKLSYEIIIPAGGSGDHPVFAVLTYAKEALASIGITLTVNDPADSNELWNRLDAGEGELWAAAWQASADPDMRQVYHSANVPGAGGTDSNKYNIVDEELDQLIEQGRQSDDQSYRKAIYKQALNIVMDWAVELPVYQRQNCTLFSAERINMDTVTPDITTFWGWMNDIEKLEMR